METGYAISFEEGGCLIKDEKISVLVAKVHMTKYHMFPLEIEDFGSANLATNSHKLSIYGRNKLIWMQASVLNL